MTTRFRLQQLAHDLRSSLLLRPAIIALVLAAASVVLVEIEERRGGTTLLGALAGEPSSAQIVLSVIAGSVMAVVSIVFSVLVMALSLASMQFSPRILCGFLRDPISQNALGVFTGTFLYSLLALRGVRTSPPFVPSLALVGAITLALASIAALIYFINHIAREIQVNHLVAHIARDAAATIDLELPEGPGVDDPPPCPPSNDSVDVCAASGGYVQLIDTSGLAALARERGLRIDVLPLPGDFVPAGGTLARLSPAAGARPALDACARAFDLGPVRTLQQDVAFGLRMIVDIGLKAISPAINDPSTCSTCIDHLADLLCRLARRRAGAHIVTDGDRIWLVMQRPTFKDLLDLAFNQLRQYGRGDLAVANRIMRALTEIAASTEDPARLEAVREQAHLVMAGLIPALLAEDRVELEARYAGLTRPPTRGNGVVDFE